MQQSITQCQLDMKPHFNVQMHDVHAVNVAKTFKDLLNV